MRGQEDKANGPDPCTIHPFLPDINEVLCVTYTGTKYEKLFAGTFVDRCQLNEVGDFPKEVLWDPLQLKRYANRRQGRSIYSTLCKTVTVVDKMMREPNLTQETKYYLTLYMDMHIPLINYIDTVVDAQKKRLNTLTYVTDNNYGILTEEMLQFHDEPSKTFKRKLAKEKLSKRFNVFFDKMKNMVTDEILCTKTADGMAVSNRLQPSQKLFDSGEIFHDGMVPDVLNHVVQCNFFTDIKKPNKHPLVHLISKALPQRCQIRNLSDILRQYSRDHDYVFNFVISCMKASLLGLYKHAVVRPPFHVRRALIQEFNEKSKMEFLSWILDDNQQLLFYIIKEFLIFSCKFIPALYSEILLRYNWTKFEDGVKMAMNTVRRYTTFDADQPMKFKDVESMLASVNKQQIHHLYRPLKCTFEVVVSNECEKIDEDRCEIYPTKEIPLKWKEDMYQMAIRTDGKTLPFHLLECFQIAPAVIDNIKNIYDIFRGDGSKGSLKQFLMDLGRHEFETIREFCDAFDRRANIRIFYLPVHTYVQQCVALRRKHKIPCGEEIPDYAGEVLVCLHCKTFKSCVNDFDNKGKPKNLYAYGHSKVLVEDVGGVTKIFCGKRCDKSDVKKRNNYKGDIDSLIDIQDASAKSIQAQRSRRKQAKDRRKKNMNIICANTELVGVSLLGRIMQFYGKLYTICPSCGNPMAYSGKYFNGEKGFYCGCCLSTQGTLFTTISCIHCDAIKNNETWDPITVLAEKGDERKQIYLCNNCNRPWIHTCNTLLKYSTIKRGLEEKWKRITHPSND